MLDHIRRLVYGIALALVAWAVIAIAKVSPSIAVGLAPAAVAGLNELLKYWRREPVSTGAALSTGAGGAAAGIGSYLVF